MNISPEENALFERITAAFGVDGQDTVATETGLPPQRPLPAGYVITALLAGSNPPIWRRFLVRSDASLALVHGVIQTGFEWQDNHLYQFSLELPFTVGALTFVSSIEFAESGEGDLAALTRLDETMQEPGDLLHYVYDYGDNWDLVLSLEDVLTLPDPATNLVPVATLLGGERAAPPEDCGGVRDEVGLLQLVDDPTSFDFDAIQEAVGAVEFGNEFEAMTRTAMLRGPEVTLSAQGFSVLERIGVFSRGIAYSDLATVTEISNRVGKLCNEQAEVPTAELATDLSLITWALEHLDGVKLTQAGYMPPKYVRELMSQMNSIFLKEAGIATEVNFLEAAELRAALTKFGLLRKYRGTLSRTKNGTAALESPEAMMQVLARALAPKGKPSFEEDARAFTLLCAATSDGASNLEMAAHLVTAAGWRHPDGSPIEYHEVAHADRSAAPFLWFIGPQANRVRHAEELSATAVLLARSALLAE